jgi:hypothetical protein
VCQAAFQYTTFEEEIGIIHSVFRAIKNHPILRHAKIFYFPESAPADAGKRCFAYANIWNRTEEQGRARIITVHEGGMDMNKQPLPGCRKTHESTELGVNHLRLQLHKRILKRLDTMIFMTNMELPTQMVSRETTMRYVLDKQLKEQMMRFMKRSMKTSNEFVDAKYVFSGKSGALQDDMVIPYVMQAYWMDRMLGSTHEMWRELSEQRHRVIVEQPRFQRPDFNEEVERLRKEGHDIYARPKSQIASQAAPLPHNAKAKVTPDTRRAWTDRVPAETGRTVRSDETITFDLAQLAQDVADGVILDE